MERISDRVVVVRRAGGPEVLELDRVQLDSPGPGQACVRHRAIGLNFIFDPQFQDSSLDLDLRAVPVTDALRAFAHVGHTFHAVVGSNMGRLLTSEAPRRWWGSQGHPWTGPDPATARW